MYKSSLRGDSKVNSISWWLKPIGFHEKLRQVEQFLVYLGEVLFQGDLHVPGDVLALLFRDRQGMHQAGNDVLSLAEKGKVAIEVDPRFLLHGVAGEENTGAGVGTEISEDHFLHHDRRTPFFRDLQVAAIGFGPVGVPGIHGGEDGLHDLAEWVLFDMDLVFLEQIPVGEGDLAYLGFRELNLACHLIEVLEVRHPPVEFVTGDAVSHSPALKEAPVAVPCSPAHMRLAAQPFGNLIIHPDVKIGVHRSRHGDGRTGADGKKERVFRVAQFFAGNLLQFGNLLPDQFLDFCRQFRVLQDCPAVPEQFGGQDKAGGNGEMVGIELFQKIGLGAEEDLVVHLRCAPVNGADDQVRVKAHDVAAEPSGVRLSTMVRRVLSTSEMKLSSGWTRKAEESTSR